MREKKVFITLALILGVLILGIVYAAITTQNLNVAGSATATTSDSNFDVSFTGEVDITKPTERADGTAITTIDVDASASGKNGTFTISGLDTKGQQVILEYGIKNNSADIYAELSDIQINCNNSTWFTIKGTFIRDSDIADELSTYGLSARRRGCGTTGRGKRSNPRTWSGGSLIYLRDID